MHFNPTRRRQAFQELRAVFSMLDRPKQPERRQRQQEVQGLLGQCALASMAILGTLATLNLQLAHIIIRETERIPPSPLQSHQSDTAAAQFQRAIVIFEEPRLMAQTLRAAWVGCVFGCLIQDV